MILVILMMFGWLRSFGGLWGLGRLGCGLRRTCRLRSSGRRGRIGRFGCIGGLRSVGRCGGRLRRIRRHGRECAGGSGRVGWERCGRRYGRRGQGSSAEVVVRRALIALDRLYTVEILLTGLEIGVRERALARR